MKSLLSPRASVALAAVALAIGYAVTASAAPTPQFSISGNVATDLRTGLQWQRGEVAGGAISRSAAMAGCAGVGVGWRLPSALELLSIVDERRAGNLHDPLVFPGASAATFWTESSYAANSFYVVDMSTGSTDITDPAVAVHRARCVH